MKQPDTKISRLLRIQEAADLLGLHTVTLRRWEDEGKISSVRVGNRRGVGDRRYKREDVEKLIKK